MVLALPGVLMVLFIFLAILVEVNVEKYRLSTFNHSSDKQKGFSRAQSEIGCFCQFYLVYNLEMHNVEILTDNQ